MKASNLSKVVWASAFAISLGTLPLATSVSAQTSGTTTAPGTGTTTAPGTGMGGDATGTTTTPGTGTTTIPNTDTTGTGNTTPTDTYQGTDTAQRDRGSSWGWLGLLGLLGLAGLRREEPKLYRDPNEATTTGSRS